MNRFATMTMVVLASTSALTSAAPAELPIMALAPFDTVLDGRDELVGVALGADGARYVSDRGRGIVYRIDASGMLTVAAANLDRPAGLALDGHGGLLIVEEAAGRIRRLEAGTLTVIATGLHQPRWIAAASDGTLYVSADRPHYGGELLRIADGAVTVVASGIDHVEGLARVNGHLLAASRGLSSHRPPTGTLLRYPVAADGTLGAPVTWVTQGLQQPMGLAADALGAMFVTSKHLTIEDERGYGAIAKVHPDAHVTEFASLLSDPHGVAFGPDGLLYVADGKSGRLLRFRAPAVPRIDPLASATNRPTVTVSGRTEAGARVDIFVHEATVPVRTVANATGGFDTPVALIENSDNGVEVFATAHAGNGLTSAPAGTSIAHDDVAPQAMFHVPLAGAHVRDVVTVQARAHDAGGAIGGVALRAGAQSLPAATTPPPPAPSVTVTASWDSSATADGGHTLIADAVDRAGNTHSVTRVVIVDNTPPETAITSAHTDDASATFTFTAHDNLTPAGGVVFAWRVDGGTYTAPADATTATLTHLTEGEHVFEVRARDLAGNDDPTPATRTFTVVFGPVISAVTPATGAAGASVTITGHNFEASAAVSFNGVAAVVRTLAPTAITTTVPVGAITGPLAVTSTRGMATHPFTVTTTVDFSIAAAPATVRAIAGDEAAVMISITGEGTFSSLAAVSTSPITTGITARFGSGFVAPGAGTSLNLEVAATASPGVYPIAVSGQAQVDGRPVVRTTSVILEVLPFDTLAVTGRVLTAESIARPIPGVTVALGTGFNVTDAGGNFVVLSPPTGRNMLLLDGRTAGTPEAQFPVVEVQVDVHAGRPTRLPFVVYLPILDNANPIDLPLDAVGFTTREVVATTPLIPDLAITIPSGTRIIGPDGNPVSQLVITPVPVDRTPMPFPDGVVPSLLFAINPGGSAPSRPLPITLPNSTKAPPGASADLWYFDLVAGAWTVWGTGTVTPDATQIASDPGYGLPRLAWHFAFTMSTSDEVRARHAKGGDPVDLVTGRFTVTRTDLALPGRMPISVQRAYRSENGAKGLFGIGWNLGIYDSTVALVGQGPSLRLILPDQSSYLLTKVDSAWRNTREPFLHGAVVSALPGDFNFQIRYKDGAVHRYERIEGFLAAALVSITDRNGNTLTIVRARGLFVRRITQIIEPAGRAVTFTYDSAERITAITDPLHRLMRYTYDAHGRLDTVIDAGGGVTRYAYDTAHRIVAVTDARNTTMLANDYDAAGRVIRQIQADGGVWRFDYFVPAPPGVSAVSAVRTHRAGSVKTSFPSTGASGRPGRVRVRRVQSMPAFTPPLLIIPAPPLTPRFGFGVSTPAPPARTTVTDPRGFETTYRFNADGFTISETDALGQTTTYAYDPATNNLTSVRDPLGRLTAYTHDADGNVLTVIDPAGQQQSFTYEPVFGKMTSRRDELGLVTRFEYDAAGNLTAAIDPLGHRTTLAYNAAGQTLTISDPLSHTVSFSYDPHGNRVSITDARQQTTTRRYDVAGRMLERRDANGRSTTFSYDSRDRMTAIIDAAAGRTGMTYDDNGNLLTVTDAAGNMTSHTYDPMNRFARRTDPRGYTEVYVRDPLGNITQRTDRKGQVSRYTYDALNRVTQAAHADGSEVLHSYDAMGRLTAVVDSAGGPLLRTYDPLDRLITESAPLGTIAYRYDAAGRLLDMQAPGHARVDYVYDDASRLVALEQAGHRVSVAHDDAGRRTRLALPNGVSTEYVYDTASQVAALVYRNAAGVLGDLVYEYDATGNRVSVGGSLARTAPPVAVSNATYAAGNRQHLFDGRAMTYDDNGNVSTVSDPNGTTTFTWDARDRLVGIDGPSDATTFTYDAFGRRSGRTVNGVAVNYLYDGDDIVLEVSTGAAVPYLRAPWPDEPFVRGSDEFPLIGAPGSVVALTDATGVPATSYAYTPFGDSIADVLPSTNPFQYAGRENDGAGLYYYRARYYSPALHRFISEDPIGFAGGDPNLYAYVYNNPTTLVDRHGLDAINWRPTPNRNVVIHGPRNGNWGGRHWSGGLTPPYYGPPAPPTDSADECYMNHDNCWGDCDTCPAARAGCMTDCDVVITRCLVSLPEDPRQWAAPPRRGTIRDTRNFRRAAIAYFGTPPFPVHGTFRVDWVMP